MDFRFPVSLISRVGPFATWWRILQMSGAMRRGFAFQERGVGFPEFSWRPQSSQHASVVRQVDSPCASAGADRAAQFLAGLAEHAAFHSLEAGFCVLGVKARVHRDQVATVSEAAMIRDYLRLPSKPSRAANSGTEWTTCALGTSNRQAESRIPVGQCLRSIDMVGSFRRRGELVALERALLLEQNDAWAVTRWYMRVQKSTGVLP